MRKKCTDMDFHSRPQSPRSFRPVAGIDPCQRQEGSWALGMRIMDSKRVEKSAPGRDENCYYFWGKCHRFGPRQGDLENPSKASHVLVWHSMDWVQRQKATLDLSNIWKACFYSLVHFVSSNTDGDTSWLHFSFWAFLEPGLNSRNVTHFLVMFL